MDTGFDPAWIDSLEPVEVYKHDARSRVWRIDAPDGRSFVIKRFEHNPFRQLLAAAFGIHPAQRESRCCRRLKSAGLPVVPIVAAGSHSKGWTRQNWLATPYVGVSLYNMLYHGQLSDLDRRARVLNAVGQLTGELIRKGLFNRDHKASNILIDDQDKPWLIDVGAVGRSRGTAGADRMLANLCDTLAQAGATDPDLAQVRRASGAISNTASKR